MSEPFDKQALRREMKLRRRGLSESSRIAASDRIRRNILSRREVKRLFSNGGTLAVYLSADGEIGLDEVIAAAVGAGVTVAAPRWNGERYSLAEFSSFEELENGPHGIREPAVTARSVANDEPSVWLVPGLAFTKKGLRLGFGGGWYDRLLASASPSAAKLGVAYDFQVVDDLPCETHDVKMDGVIDDLAVSLEFEERQGDVVIGVDEAGRGPLVGGVYAAAVSVPLTIARELLVGPWSAINDSKQLSGKKRAILSEVIRETHGCVWAIKSASAREIDELNILRATHLAMGRAVSEVTKALSMSDGQPHVLVDGLPVASLPNSCNVVKGDAKSLLIAAASILAKTARDADCLRLERLYPGYGFAKHKGYPTKEHMAALEKLGPCPEHRRSFGPVSQLTLTLE